MNVEQIKLNGEMCIDYDTKESTKKFYERIAKLTKSTVERKGSKYLLKKNNSIIALKQVTYLGNPHPHYKKRAQMPKWFPEVYREYTDKGFKVFFMGVYTYQDNVVMFNFHLNSYINNKFNNSSAHVMINDIYQATTTGYYKKIDRNKNIIDCFRSEYLEGVIEGAEFVNDELKVINEFNSSFEFNEELNVMRCVPEMASVNWPDKNQGEWPGFYLEYRYDKYLRSNEKLNIMQFQKVKEESAFDFDLYFPAGNFYGDLKSSTNTKSVSPGNDKESLDNYLKSGKKFWYLIYEHYTKLAKENNDIATIEWNKFRAENGYKKLQDDIKNGKIDWMLSYKNRLKESVTYTGMFVLEINDANKHHVFTEFNQGKQPDGSKRKGKYMIKKKDIENFIVYRY